MSNHPWSSSPAAQAAIRAAEVDRGPQIAHRDVPEAVERLAERVARLEAQLALERSGVELLSRGMLMDDEMIHRLTARVRELEASAPQQERVVRLPDYQSGYLHFDTVTQRLTAAGVRWEVGE